MSTSSHNERPKRKGLFPPIEVNEKIPTKKIRDTIPTPSSSQVQGNFPPIRISVPEEENCKLSDNIGDICRTFCKICGLSFTLSNMRSHTLSKHELQITKYKEQYGQHDIIEKVFHKCKLCDKIVLLANDILGGHIKSAHKMKERVYKEKYMNCVDPKQTSNQSENQFESNKTETSTKSQMQSGNYSKTTFPDFEYSCNLKHCELCDRPNAEVILDLEENLFGKTDVKDEIDVTNISTDHGSMCNNEDILPKPESQLGLRQGGGGWSKKFLPSEIIGKVDDKFDVFDEIDYKDQPQAKIESVEYIADYASSSEISLSSDDGDDLSQN